MKTVEKEKLWEEYQKNPSAELREKIIIEYAPLVRVVAGRLSMYLGYNVEYEDLVSYGIFGLIDAIDKFDRGKDVKFETYASLRIRGSILDQIRKMDWIPRTVRQKRKKIEEAIKQIETKTGRNASDEEIAQELGIGEEELNDWQTQLNVTNVISLNEFVEQRKSLIYLDSMMVVKQAQLDSVKGNFVLEKDTAYQEVGNYFYPTQTVEKNIGRSFLRGQVNEQGEMSLTSIYCAGGTLHHTAVKVSVGDTFAETPASKDSYETTDLGRAIEKADYKMGEDGGVIAFIVANKDKNIQLQFIGDRTYKTAMQPNDRKAIAELTELARILSGMEQIRKDKKEANLKIEFVTRKMQEQEEEK